MKQRSESRLHFEIKRAALLHLHARMGARLLGLEVRYRGPSFEAHVADVAGHADGAIVETTVGPRGGIRRRTLGRRDDLIVVEVKASRSDFLRDASVTAEITRRIGLAAAEMRRVEERLARDDPSLFRSRTLFEADGRWEFERSPDPERCRLESKLRRLEERLHRGTKFEAMALERAFHRHYVAAPVDILDPSELPPGWGLLAFRPPRRLDLVREAERSEVAPQARERVLREIARSGTRALLRLAGVRYREDGPFIPEDEDETGCHAAGDDGGSGRHDGI